MNLSVGSTLSRGVRERKQELINSYYGPFQLKFDFQILAFIYKLCSWHLQMSSHILQLI